MKNLKDFEKYNNDKTNESLYGQLSRLSPKRYKNDVKASTLIDDMIEDFEQNGKNLRKVSFFKNKNEISLDRIEVGTSGRLSYVFGKYHPVRNSTMSRNNRAGNHKVSISYIPTELVLRKNELEKGFGTSRFQLGFCRVKEEIIEDNPDYNPNISMNLDLNEIPTERQREMMRMFNEKEYEYEVSPDVATKILKYFIKEYKRQYPTIVSKYKNSMGLDEFEKGIKQTLDYIHGRDIEGKEVTAGLYQGENKKDLLAQMKSMTKDEFEKMRQELKSKEYEGYDKKEKIKFAKVKEEAKKAIYRLIEKYPLEINENIDIRVNRGEVMINLRVKGDINKVKPIVDKISKEFPPIWNDKYQYTYDTNRVSKGYKYVEDSILYVTLRFETTEYN